LIWAAASSENKAHPHISIPGEELPSNITSTDLSYTKDFKYFQKAFDALEMIKKT